MANANSSTNNRILVTGAGGLLGVYLCNRGCQHGEVFRLGRSSGTILADLTDREQTGRIVSEISPTIVIHAAAMTDVEECEKSPDEADRQNRIATRNLVIALPKKSRLVYISTDQVYPDTLGPHKEGTEAPVNQYGKSKLAGEREALSHENTISVRTNLFGPSLTSGRASLSDFIIKNLSASAPTTLFRDIFFSPLHLDTLSAQIWELTLTGFKGTCNLGAREGISKAEFGLAVAAQKKLPLKNVTISDSGGISNRAPRSLDLRMDVAFVESILGSTMPTALEEIRKL
jgi:dTDP-4-dehydrorhamnose reductase